jgi:Bacterial Ig-like domain
LPLPFNTNTTYLDDYGNFIKAIGIIYGGKPDFKVISASGPTSVSDEFTEPNTPTDVLTWTVDLQYTLPKYLGAWQTMFSDYNSDFPNQYVSLAHGNGIGFSVADPNPAVTKLVKMGHQTFRGRFIFQSSALTGLPTHKSDAIDSVVQRIGIDKTGFEFGGTAENGPEKQGDTKQSPVAAVLTIDRGLELKPSGKGHGLHADYIEIHEPDVAADELQPVLAWAKPLVLHNDPNTNDPLNVIMTAAEGEYGADGIMNPDIIVYVTFSEPVTGFDQRKLQVTDGGISDFSQVGRKGLARQEYSFVLTPTAPNQTATVYLKAGVAKDSSHHQNTASPPFSFTHFAHMPPITTQ